MVDSPEQLRRQARAVAARGKGPNEAWSELRSWASGKGPVAMKSAMMEFISMHAASPEAALLMPQLLRDQTLSPIEKREVQALAKDGPMKHADTLTKMPPRFNAPSDKAFSLRPAQARPPFALPSPGDHDAMRNMHLTIAEKTRLTLGRPSPATTETPKFDSSKSPDSVVMGASHKGEHLVHSLVERLRGHGRDEHPVKVISGEPKPQARKPAKKAKRGAPARKAQAPKKKSQKPKKSAMKRKPAPAKKKRRK